MKYLTTIPLKLKTQNGEVELKPGDTFKPKSEEAIKELLAEGKVKPFCFWLRELVDTCQEPCSEAEGMKTTRECPHFTIFWEGRFKELIGGSK